MVNNALLEKINKLLALANSPNENEAALAAEKATELLTKYNLSIADLGPDEEETIRTEAVETTSRYVTWKMLLLAGIATANGCRALRSKNDGNMTLIGTQTNIAVAQSLYKYLTKAVERLAKRHKGKGRAFLNAFRVGCSTRIRHRLEQRRKEMEEEGIAGNSENNATPAIVVRSMFEKNDWAIQEYLNNEGFKVKTQRAEQISSELGYYYGYQAGDRVNLNQQQDSGSSIKKLKSQ
ncbi:MAG: DUF2786 domain-containing protein [Okeania sp. SIO2H7]|nr:DUF2786 domain-containing protein [Okeania sp. SIO2H7]